MSVHLFRLWIECAFYTPFAFLSPLTLSLLASFYRGLLKECLIQYNTIQPLPPPQDLHTVDFTPYQTQQGRVNVTGFRLLRDDWEDDSCVQSSRKQDWRTEAHQLTVSLFTHTTTSTTKTVAINPRPTGGGGYFEPPSRFLAISSKPLQVSPPNLQYPLSQHFYTLC